MNKSINRVVTKNESNPRYEHYIKYDANENRVFLNNILHCDAKCTYCYLKQPKLSNIVNKTIIPSSELIKQLENIKGFKYGSNGTIVTVGSFSECFSSKVINETVQLINHFLKKGNYVQAATKKQISDGVLKSFSSNIKFKNQLTVFTTVAVITDNDIVESGADGLTKRLENFIRAQKYSIDCVLYIKPVLDGITINDVSKYIQIITDYNIDNVSVGGLYSEEGQGECKSFTDDILRKTNSAQPDLICQQLAIYCNVYTSSYKYMMTNVEVQNEV